MKMIYLKVGKLSDILKNLHLINEYAREKK